MSCQCYTAVTRTYRNLRDRGLPEDHAFSASVRVFRYYHPEQRQVEALDTVGDWLDSLDRPGALPPSH